MLNLVISKLSAENKIIYDNIVYLLSNDHVIRMLKSLMVGINLSTCTTKFVNYNRNSYYDIVLDFLLVRLLQHNIRTTCCTSGDNSQPPTTVDTSVHLNMTPEESLAAALAAENASTKTTTKETTTGKTSVALESSKDFPATKIPKDGTLIDLDKEPKLPKGRIPFDRKQSNKENLLDNELKESVNESKPSSTLPVYPELKGRIKLPRIQADPLVQHDYIGGDANFIRRRFIQSYRRYFTRFSTFDYLAFDTYTS